jgi:hypothetical protein
LYEVSSGFPLVGCGEALGISVAAIAMNFPGFVTMQW